MRRVLLAGALVLPSLTGCNREISAGDEVYINSPWGAIGGFDGPRQEGYNRLENGTRVRFVENGPAYDQVHVVGTEGPIAGRHFYLSKGYLVRR